MPEKLNFEDFISGGYFLVRIIPRPKDFSGLIPEYVLTISECFTDVAPDVWADSGYDIQEPERIREASKFGIPSSALISLITEFTKAARIDGWSNAFADVTVARHFYEASTGKDRLAIIGIGLDKTLMSDMKSQLGDDVNKGAGLTERVNLRRTLADGGRAMGFEPLGFAAMKFHSWLCHNEPPNAEKQFGVRPNGEGFIDNFSDALRVTRNLKATGAEPAIWLPWLIVRYDTERR